MAYGKSRIRTTEKIYGVSLELSIEEAKSLLAVTARVGGSPNGRRGDIDSIRVAIYQAMSHDPSRKSWEADDRAVQLAKEFDMEGSTKFSD